jgi:hypothetical protein
MTSETMGFAFSEVYRMCCSRGSYQCWSLWWPRARLVPGRRKARRAEGNRNMWFLMAKDVSVEMNE